MTMAAFWDLDDEPAPRPRQVSLCGEQIGLFPPITSLALAEGVSPRDYGLRWYQLEAYERTLASLETNRSTLVVMATGLGKTVFFAAVAGNWTDGDVLILVHRDELVRQARDTLERLTGEMVEIEQGQERSSSSARIVVASTQTIMRQNRLDRMGKDRFGLVIVDEVHHYVSKSFRKPIDWFERAKVLGVTATPDRGDEKALGQILDDVAYVMDIGDGIDSGFLVPVLGEAVNVDAIDISQVGTSGGDLVAAQLDEAMLKAVEGVVHESVRLYPDRPGIWFWPGVKTAEYCAAKFNLLQPGSCGFISGATPTDERRQLIDDFRQGRLLRLSNCAVLTEGFDAPRASVIGMARPTKSRALYTQCVGRGTRTTANVDQYRLESEAPLRRKVIAASDKPDCLILDFVGNSGKHSLIGPEDVLGGKYSEAEVALAKKKKDPLGNVRKSLEEARRELRRIAAGVNVKVQATVRKFDPFNVFGMERESDEASVRFGYKSMTPGQREALLRMGLKADDVDAMSRAEASKMLGASAIRRKFDLANYKQMRLLQSFGVTETNISFPNASNAITYIKSCGWKVGSPAKLNEILHAPREAGEEG